MTAFPCYRIDATLGDQELHCAFLTDGDYLDRAEELFDDVVAMGYERVTLRCDGVLMLKLECV